MVRRRPAYPPGVRHPKPVAVALALALALVALPGCSENPKNAAVMEALDSMIRAIEGRDWRQVWDLTAPAGQDDLLALHAELHAAVRAVPDVYEEDDRDAAAAAVGDALIEGIEPGAPDAGERLVSRLLAPDAVRLDEKARAGLYARGAVVAGDHAVIHTSAGEAFTFQLDARGQWRSLLVMDILNQSREVTVLRENAQALLAAAAERREAWQTSRDARAPQGAYNLARAALEREPVDAATLFALLDPPSRDTLLEALETARAAQKAIQRRMPRKQREAAYADAGISLHVQADSDRSLFEAWCDSKHFAGLLPDVSAPDHVDGDSDSDAVTVVTVDGGKVLVTRGADGHWRLAGAKGALDAALLEPAVRAAAPPAPAP